MAQPEANLEISYGFIIMGVAAVAFGTSKLLALKTLLANWIAGVIVFLAALTCLVGIVHYWRYKM